ncbi:MAG: hypothetical protein ACRCSB_06770 [Bacteroidales bacterium]
MLPVFFPTFILKRYSQILLKHTISKYGIEAKFEKNLTDERVKEEERLIKIGTNSYKMKKLTRSCSMAYFLLAFSFAHSLFKLLIDKN